MERLLRQAQQGTLTDEQEADLRQLIVRRNPRAADLPRDWLIRAGVVLVGTDVLREALLSTR